MIILRRKLDISDFFNLCDLNTAQGQEEFERILNYMRQQMYSEIPSALYAEFNELGNGDYEYNNYVVECKKVAWDEKRLNEEINKYKISGSIYYFRGNPFRYDIFKGMVSSVKPFDLYLYIKTIDEYKNEELINLYKKTEVK